MLLVEESWREFFFAKKVVNHSSLSMCLEIIHDITFSIVENILYCKILAEDSLRQVLPEGKIPPPF